MAKRKTYRAKSQKRYTPIGRGYLTPTASLLPRTQKIYQNLDNRFFSFPISTLPRHPLTRYGARAAVSPVVKKGRSLHAQFQIHAPRKTLVCIRRKTRQEVLFALGKGGRKHGTRKVRRNSNSSFQC